jgi:hypothetical protein
VPKEEIVKGWKFEKGRYLLVPEAELEELRVTQTKTIDIKEFVPSADGLPFLQILRERCRSRRGTSPHGGTAVILRSRSCVGAVRSGAESAS